MKKYNDTGCLRDRIISARCRPQSLQTKLKTKSLDHGSIARRVGIDLHIKHLYYFCTTIIRKFGKRLIVLLWLISFYSGSSKLLYLYTIKIIRDRKFQKPPSTAFPPPHIPTILTFEEFKLMKELWWYIGILMPKEIISYV